TSLSSRAVRTTMIDEDIFRDRGVNRTQGRDRPQARASGLDLGGAARLPAGQALSRKRKKGSASSSACGLAGDRSRKRCRTGPRRPQLAMQTSSDPFLERGLPMSPRTALLLLVLGLASSVAGAAA